MPSLMLPQHSKMPSFGYPRHHLEVGWDVFLRVDLTDVGVEMVVSSHGGGGGGGGGGREIGVGCCCGGEMWVKRKSWAQLPLQFVEY